MLFAVCLLVLFWSVMDLPEIDPVPVRGTLQLQTGHHGMSDRIGWHLHHVAAKGHFAFHGGGNDQVSDFNVTSGRVRARSHPG